MSDVNDLLWGGGGPPTLGFPTLGTTHEGRIMRMESVRRTDVDTGAPLTWPDGRPQMQLVLHLQTDAGMRRIFLRWKSLEAFREALLAAGLERGESPLGGTLKIQWASGGERRGAKSTPKEYRCRFTPGVAPDVQELIDPADADPKGADDDIPF